MKLKEELKGVRANEVCEGCVYATIGTSLLSSLVLYLATGSHFAKNVQNHQCNLKDRAITLCGVWGGISDKNKYSWEKRKD